MGSANAQRKGVWEPLPLIVYGYAVHPLSPSKRDTRLSSRRPMSTITEGSADESGVHRDVVSLEVGDEVYAFEKYTPRGNQADGIWYRGYVVCTARLPPVTWSTSSDPTSSSSAKPVKTEEPQQVFIGIFPASHIFVRDELSDAEGRLPDLWKRERANSGPEPPREHRERDREVRELTYDDERKSFKLGPPPDQAKSTRAALVVYPASIHSVPDSENMKPLPPRPSLKSGDDTASGALQPIIDEIASALREWHSMMFQYLARRDYKLFHTVREHIEALHLGRRQLLAQTLSAEETVSLRRDCVARLDLDIIVRHPTWGALVTVDVEGEIDPRSWVSAVRMYAMQTSLAYINLTIGPSEFSTIPIPTPAHSAFPDISRHKTISRQVGSLGPYQPEKPTAAKFYHIFLDLRETAELFFSVYKHSEFPKFVTEDCCIVLNHNGVLSRDPNARIRTLFIDIAQSDAQDPLFLVCRIMNNTMGSGAPASLPDVPLTPSRTTLMSELPMNFRRPFGCAVLELSQLTKMMVDGTDVSPMKEHCMPIFVPTNEALFSMLHQDIITNNVKEFEKSPRAEMLAVSVKIFHGDSSTVIRENMSLLQDIPLTLRLGFPDVVFPGDVRNELYIKLWTGDFPSSPSGSARLSMVNFTRPGPVSQNAQVSIEVRDQEGRTIENAISLGSGESSVTQFHSMVFMRNNQPTFGELIKLQLPLRGIPNWHLFFTFRNRSGRGLNADKPFAFAFQPLFPGQGAFLEDGSHTLVLYRADKLLQITTDMYLASSPWVLPGQRPEQVSVSPDLLKLASPMRDTVIIRSSLCSTKFTQNPVLMSLLNWEQINDKELLQTVLSKFTFVGEGEIVKFLRDIFDSLFGIMESQNNQAGEMDHLVFSALVTVLGIVQDRRFSNFQPVLDVYIEQHFNCAAASSHMIRSMDRLLRNPTDNDAASPLRAALKVWHYIFKFITRARELQKSTELGMGDGATAEHLETMFKKEIRCHLIEVNKMMATTSPASIIGTQTIALQHFTSILPELAKIIPTIELVTVTTNFVNASSTGKGKIIIWRLIMYLQIVKGFLFDNPNSRSLLVQAVVILPAADSDSVRDGARISWLESIRLCVTILAVMLDKLQLQLVSSSVMADRNLFRQEQENIEYILMLMPRLLDSYREFQNPANHRAVERTRTRTPTTTTAAVPVTFPESYPFSLMALLPNAPRNATSTSLTHEDNLVFNPGLGETAIVLLSLLLSAPTKHIYNFLESSYDIEGKENFASLLTQFFKVAISILENDAFPNNWLNVNILTHKVLIKMMDPIATLLKRIFIPPPLASHQFKTELWKDAFFMLLKLLSSEQLVIEDFSPQKRRAVWRLGGDIRGEGADILLRLWEALAWPEPTESSSVSQGGYQAVLSSLIGYIVNLCLSHHDQLRNNAVGILFGMIISEYHQYGHFDQIETELVRKLDSLFMSQSKGDDISRVFFIAQLRHLFESSERVSAFLDSVDAFLKLLLNVRSLPEGEEFADDRVIATLRLMNFIRDIGREEMYIKYVHQLVNAHLQSQNYVEAALTLKLHSDLHNWDLYSFVGPMEDLGLPQQSHFHRKETLCLLILDYLGKGKAYESAIEICKELAMQHAETFPDALRNKQFIYRGYEWEKFGTFCERLLNKHPGAQLLKIDPTADQRFGNDQYIQCTAVTPEPDRSLPIFTSPDVPLAIRNYYEHSAINVFSSTKQITKFDRDGNEEMWLEKTRSDITEWEVAEISPVENALHEVEQKSRELASFHLRYAALAKTAQVFSTNALSMSLNGAVDPAVDGLPVYREIFFDPAYSIKHPDRVEMIDRLRVAIDEQVRVTDSCLKLHGQICPQEMLRFHQTLEELFRKNFAEEIRRISAENGFQHFPQSSAASIRIHDQSSSYDDRSRQRSLSNSSGRPSFGFPLSVSGSSMSPQPISPLSSRPPLPHHEGIKRTPLQMHAAHVARHGINGVLTGWRDAPSDTTTGSPRDSLITVGNTGPAHSGASVAMSTIGSVNSIKGRLSSRFGSFTRSRRG
ncbi:C2 domain in Dock180 and Zizimin proteins-domain-containing protein [Suillus subalutaceus]|uniref:C2 domain in Dock180 and Zizimin proteins-domain-containing protein n=1 Tax=Suillus subalutaceus TaxID=48586 RepID=UPI001B87B2A0|nr:C2 domain in Dock180 and Zizimin proteins-domain-containing protein [Suillus subalutaceus]KAG1865874.1 C2 domain in Dock180 and Zizimin proteins-domain-containing protein [Suillus subalutaceus]